MADTAWPPSDPVDAPQSGLATSGAPAASPEAIARGQQALALLNSLEATPSAHGFFQTMRRLEALYPDSPGFGRSVRPSQDVLRLAQEPSSIFASATFAAFEPGVEGRPSRLLTYFFGLFGPDGPLPLHLTDFARDRLGAWAVERFLDFVDFLANFGKHKSGVAPIEPHAGCLGLEFDRAGQAGQGDGNIGKEARLCVARPTPIALVLAFQRLDAFPIGLNGFARAPCNSPNTWGCRRIILPQIARATSSKVN